MIGSFIGSEHQETFAAADCRHMPHPASAPLRGHPAQRQTGAAAFSLVDLLTLIGVLVLLGLLLTPALARTRVSDQSFQCMHNLRQLMAATLMYTHDYHDLFPPNPDDGNTTPGYNWCPGMAGIAQPNEYDPDILKDPKRSLLAPYQGSNVSVYHCPADMRPLQLANGESITDPALRGRKIPNARTVSMNLAVGTNPYLGGRFPVDGAWLDGHHTNTRNGPWFTYASTTSVLTPTPATLFVLLDENPGSLNDACFSVTAATNLFVDWPGVFHNLGCSFAFADGHCEHKRWQDPRTAVLTGQTTPYDPPNPDVLWLQERTTALK
jgi:prepilin-type processing-associated H-X9-DG protein